MGTVIIISGERFAGKSTLCRRLITTAQTAGRQVAGLVTELIDPHTLHVTELHTGARYPLTRPWRGSEGPLHHFVMDEEALARSDAALATALPADLLVLDELGPTELVMGQGWQRAIPLVREGNYRTALVVVRPTLLATALSAFGKPIVTTAWVTPANREELFLALKRRIL